MWFIPKPHPEIRNRTLLTVTAVLAVLVFFGHGHSVVLADGTETFGVFGLVPILTVLVLALISRRTLEPLFVGALVGLMMLDAHPEAVVRNLSEVSLKVMAGPVMGWILLLCLMTGGLMMWMQKSRATESFSLLLSSRVRTRSQSIVAAWFLGILIFIDDYLSALTVGSAMQKLTDRFGVSRAMLAYVADATAAPMCLLIPISTWGIYLAGLLESNHLAPAGGGMAYYVQVIPYIFYAWAAVLLVPLAAYGVVKPGRSMARAEAAARQAAAAREGGLAELPVSAAEEGYSGRAHVMYFVLPLAVMVACTWLMGDTLIGVMCAAFFTLVLYRFLHLANLYRLCSDFMEGMLTMVTPVAIIFVAFVLQDVNEKLGLSPYLIDMVKPLLTPQWLPVVTFVLLSALTFATGSFWGVYAIAFPIIVPLAVAVEANIPLTLGALVSAGGFGSQACMFGDSTVLSARSTGITPMEHALTQLPYALIAAVAAALLFAVLGWAV